MLEKKNVLRNATFQTIENPPLPRYTSSQTHPLPLTPSHKASSLSRGHVYKKTVELNEALSRSEIAFPALSPCLAFPGKWSRWWGQGLLFLGGIALGFRGFLRSVLVFSSDGSGSLSKVDE